jgi:hypothetical protein
MCIKCARRTPVGYRCKECVSNQQAIFYSAQPLDPVIQIVVSGLLSAVAAGIIGFIGGSMGIWLLFLITIPASGFAGGLIADIAHRAVGKRYGKYGWMAVGAGVILGALAVGIIPTVMSVLLYTAFAQQAGGEFPGILYVLAGGGGYQLIGLLAYAVVATGAAVARLRMGK